MIKTDKISKPLQQFAPFVEVRETRHELQHLGRRLLLRLVENSLKFYTSPAFVSKTFNRTISQSQVKFGRALVRVYKFIS